MLSDSRTTVHFQTVTALCEPIRSLTLAPGDEGQRQIGPRKDLLVTCPCVWPISASDLNLRGCVAKAGAAHRGTRPTCSYCGMVHGRKIDHESTPVQAVAYYAAHECV